ncbi:MAG: GNAT family N-acetyltransferase [Pirellulales bacterium]
MINIRPAQPSDLQDVAALFRQYADELAVDLAFQGFADELANLPGAYAPPRGALLVADANATLIGCVAMRPLSGDACEMKRLFVRPAYRRSGLASRLCEELFRRAASAGYRTMKLDTLSTMDAAVALYRELGFRTTDAYYHNPLESAAFFEREL